MRKIIVFIMLLFVFNISIFAEKLKSKIKNINYSGVVEVEFNYADNENAKNTSDFCLSTVQLGFNSELGEKLKSEIILLYEEGEDNDQIKIDEGKIIYKINNIFSVVAGKIYLPFGDFTTNMISDPLTEEIGEISKTSTQLNIDLDKKMLVRIAIFNGEEEAGEDNDNVREYVINLSGLTHKVNYGLSYISNAVSIDDIKESELTYNSATQTLNDKGNAYHIFLSTEINKFNFIAEYISTGSKIKIDNNEYEISGYNTEVGYKINEKLLCAFRYEQKENETTNLGIKQQTKNFGIGLSYSLYDDTNLSFEYLNNKIEQTGNSDKTNQLFNIQLSYEF